MTLRTKTLLIVGLVLSTLLLALFGASRSVLRSRFSELERQGSEETSERTMMVLSTMLHEVELAGRGWAGRADPRPAEHESELELFGLDACGTFGPMGETDSLAGWDRGTHSVRPFPAGLLDTIKGRPLANRAGTGLVACGEGVMLVSLLPLNRPDGSNGTLVVARGLDAALATKLSQTSMMVLAREPGLDPVQAANPGDEHAPMLLRRTPEGAMVSTTVLRDIWGEPTLMLRSYSRRLVAEQSELAERHAALALMTAGGLSLALSFVLLGRLVLGRLRGLSKDLEAITSGERQRVEVRGQDELAAVAQTVNRTLDALARSREGLAESEARFRSMADSSPLGIFLCGPGGETVYRNPACEQVLGQTTREGQTAGWWDAVHPGDRARVIGEWHRAMASGGRLCQQYRVVDRGAGVRWVTCYAGPIVQNGGVQGYVGTMEDSTVRLNAQEELRRAKIDAEAASLAKSTFLANMSHEIRTPMTAILGFADLMTDPNQSESERLGCIETIRRNGEGLLVIVNDILDLSRIEAGQMSIETIACSPSQTAWEVVTLLEVRAREKGISLTLEVQDGVPAFIRSDPMRLRQMLTNLVNNAVKFTQAGSVRVVLRLEDAPARSRLCIDVIDTGIGISEEQISRLFRPFSQADNSMARRFGGTGLGLSICARLASMLGGEITVRSKLGEGSTFTLKLDGEAAEAPAAKDGTLPLQAGPGTPAPSSLEGRILLAEDGIDNQRLISFLLIRAGAEVEVAENGKVAVDVALRAVAEGKPFSLILMDMQMPEMDGYAATKLLRERGFNGMIVALTAHAMVGDRQKCIAAGCDDFATKPIDKNQLIARCAQWAKARRRAA